MKALLCRAALIIWVCAIVSIASAQTQYGSAQAQSDPASPPTKQPTMLKAGVEHSETVQPLDPQLMPGRRFDPNAVALGAPVDEWICIPPWFAGTFQVNNSLVAEFIDYRTRTQLTPNRMEKIFRTFHYGHQLDSNGRVWHLNRCPYRNSIETERTVQYNLIRSSRFLHSGNDSVVETATGPALVVAKDTGVIARSTTIETFGRFESNGNGIRKTTSIKGFSPAGTPEDLIVRIEQATMVEPFAPDPSTAQSFARFMAQRQAQKQYQQMQDGRTPQSSTPYIQGSPMQGTPMQGYPMQGSPMQGSPMQGWGN
jgi:hypothetical protein